ncbi:hypothetical protein B0H19DRAFT_1259786 [Mycena capillaripes]|nr:hypothetical protein B0H19DRAFT_1259786 [Mycena capillaripes]
MTTIPQELVEAILVDFDPREDRKSLKFIALTAVNFAGPAQRVIFRSLALHTDNMPAFERMMNLLNGSPHLASYVKDLTITLPHKTFPDHHGLLQLVLPKFRNVRRFILNGLGVSWHDLQPGLQSTFSAFLSRSSLEKLHLIHICDFPLAIITRAAQTIPLLSVQNVSIEKKEKFETLKEPTPSPAPRLTHLILSSPRGVQFSLFEELASSPTYTVNLRHLAIDQSTFSEPFLEAVACTLTSLQLNCTATFEPFTLPVLRHVTALRLQVVPNWQSILPKWLPQTLASLSDALPALRTLTLRVALPVQDEYAHRQDLALPGTPRTAAVLAAVDAVLCGAAPVPRCIWELTVANVKTTARRTPFYIGALRETAHGAEAGKTHGALVFARFRAAVERNASGLKAEGGMEVRYAEQLGYVESLP